MSHSKKVMRKLGGRKTTRRHAGTFVVATKYVRKFTRTFPGKQERYFPERGGRAFSGIPGLKRSLQGRERLASPYHISRSIDGPRRKNVAAEELCTLSPSIAQHMDLWASEPEEFPRRGVNRHPLLYPQWMNSDFELVCPLKKRKP